MNTSELYEQFEWIDVVHDDRPRLPGTHDVVELGLISGQVVVRLAYDSKALSYEISEVLSTDADNTLCTRLIRSDIYGRDNAKAYAEDYLFGALRTRIVCKSCSCLVRVNQYVEDVKQKLARQQLCHSCDFWYEKIGMKDDPSVAIIGGIFYTVAAERRNVPKSALGHGGRKLSIQWHNGRSTVTTNLWSCGAIPELFKDRLKDNAVFVRDSNE